MKIFNFICNGADPEERQNVPISDYVNEKLTWFHY